MSKDSSNIYNMKTIISLKYLIHRGKSVFQINLAPDLQELKFSRNKHFSLYISKFPCVFNDFDVINCVIFQCIMTLDSSISRDNLQAYLYKSVSYYIQ